MGPPYGYRSVGYHRAEITESRIPASWMSLQAVEAESAPEEEKELAKGEGLLTEALGV